MQKGFIYTLEGIRYGFLLYVSIFSMINQHIGAAQALGCSTKRKNRICPLPIQITLKGYGVIRRQ